MLAEEKVVLCGEQPESKQGRSIVSLRTSGHERCFNLICFHWGGGANKLKIQIDKSKRIDFRTKQITYLLWRKKKKTWEFLFIKVRFFFFTAIVIRFDCNAFLAFLITNSREKD